MEAGDTALDRAQANLRKAAEVWASVRLNAKPDTQSRPGSSGGGVVRNFAHLTRGDLLASPIEYRGRWGGTKDDPPTRQEKSDRPIRAMKPGNAGGAKGATE